MAAHKFDPANSRKLDIEQRRLLLPPETILEQIGVNKHEVWADIGSGTGYFTIPLAERVREVYAIDISQKMLDILAENIEPKKLHNIKMLLSEESILPLSDHSLDGILISLVAHELVNPKEYFKQQLARILAPGGKLIVIEWLKVQTEMGPPLEDRLTTAQIDLWSEQSGLTKGRSWQWSGVFSGSEYQF